MPLKRSSVARVSRGAATFSIAAALLAAGFVTPANAAQGVPFDPTVSVTVPQDTALGSLPQLSVQLDAVAGQEWTDAGTQKAPVNVRVDVYGSYADGAVPAESPTVPNGTTPVASGSFIADKGPGSYPVTTNLNLGSFTYGAGNYTFVATVDQNDGSNIGTVSSTAVSPFAAPTATTRVDTAPSVIGSTDQPVTAGSEVTANLAGSGFNGKSLEVTSTLYGPYVTEPADAATPPGGPKVGTVLTTFTGGTATTTGIKVTEPGIYVWYHSIAAGQGAPAYTPSFTSTGNTVQVLAAALPPITRPVNPNDVVPSPQPSAPETTTPVVRVPSDGVGGGSAIFANCSDALAAGVTDIKIGDPRYDKKLDRDGDGIACESSGQDTAVAIDGGFAQASSVDNTPFIAGGVAMVLLALGFGTTVLVRKKTAGK